MGKNKLNVGGNLDVPTVFPHPLLFGKSQCSQAHFYLQLFTDIPMYLLHII